ncbi:MAG: fatty acid desaturase family protein, partial [Haloechinothrix sp.]
GNLSHQIEHHLFPDIPARRYPEIAPEVRAICEKYGLPYNTGPLHKQLFSVAVKICKLALPWGGRHKNHDGDPKAVTVEPHQTPSAA